ncbi:MAG: imidazole glycerol phosphate synthase subunit HisF [Planctomycetaceae bacterium]|jgi:cyclase|nr:imidazole glycerol phosphate synthase subunit HisF [Planctomycetaceae bacterium]
MLKRRIIPCLDVINRRVTKGIKFQSNVDLGDPVELALRYYEDGADELVVYDITASAEGRAIDIDMVRSVAEAIRIPFSVGGGISSVADMERVLEAGAEKISVNSLAVRNPSIISEGAKAFGEQCIVLSMDPVFNPEMPSNYEVTTRGFRERTGMDAVEWGRQAEGLGAGEVVVNSVDADGTRSGFELVVTSKIADVLSVPVVASGGAGSAEHLRDAFDNHADAAIIAGILHTRLTTITKLKQRLFELGVPVRM